MVPYFFPQILSTVLPTVNKTNTILHISYLQTIEDNTIIINNVHILTHKAVLRKY